ncbi:MAG TPA: heavy metal-binding domain-containing protein [Candidatus Bathyarchaeia archaeon]|nr:heavy metal-binding domain-containing protein [Candidatus Bathyarchaeia archaeon]
MLLCSLFSLAALLLAGGPGGGPTSALFAQEAFGCPMHPEVRSGVPGACSKCGMALVRMGPGGGKPYRVRVATEPSAVRAGEPVKLRFSVADPVSDAAVTRFEIVHEMPFHLFIVSDDLAHYDHIHPEPREDGTLEVVTTLPRAGAYSLFCDFLPTGGTPQVIRLRLATDGAVPPRESPRAPLIKDTVFSKTVDGIRFDLQVVPQPPAAGRVAVLQYHLTDAATGRPVEDLEPYLAAWGHTLILSDDASEYVHSHPAQAVPPGTDPATARGGPDVSFSGTMTAPGLHRAWSQFKRGGKVTTVSFTFDVAISQHLARWDGTRWRPMGDGGLAAALDGPVYALAMTSKGLYAGGEFRTAGGSPAPFVARWDGTKWQALGDGLAGPVWAIAVSGKDVYAGGEFPGGIARWDGRRWTTVGRGVDGTVSALAVFRGRVVAGGRYGTAGGAPARSIAAWDGTRWTPLGEGVAHGDAPGIVWALAQHGNDLYVAGEFLTAGPGAAGNVARWDGTRWHALGKGLRGGAERVSALAFRGSDLVAGGEFTWAGDGAAVRLAAWDGSAWRPLDVETSETVRALAVGSGLIVGGGAFQWAGGGRTNGIARRGDAGWSALGDGISGGAFLAPVLAVAAGEGEVYAGGGPFILR